MAIDTLCWDKGICFALSLSHMEPDLIIWRDVAGISNEE